MSDEDVPLDEIERFLLGARRSLTRREVADRAGIPLELAEELWNQLGFARTSDDDVAFTDKDVEALKLTADLVALGVLDPESQAALVRTWGRSFARLAEWQVALLADAAVSGDGPDRRLDELMTSVVPNVEQLQGYIWRRHLASAAQRLLPSAEATEQESRLAVAFCDIVGYTSQSKNLTEAELVELVDLFEGEATRAVVAAGGRVIKTIGDEVLYVAEDVLAAVEVALVLTEAGEDAASDFPRVRAGVAFGQVTTRLGDVYGATVNIASRLTSLARPGTVLVDREAFGALTGRDEDHAEGGEDRNATDGPALARLIDLATEELSDLSPFAEHGDLKFRRLRRQSVKGYRHLEPWVVRHARTRDRDRGREGSGRDDG